jgi:hypothetical protein
MKFRDDSRSGTVLFKDSDKGSLFQGVNSDFEFSPRDTIMVRGKVISQVSSSVTP